MIDQVNVLLEVRDIYKTFGVTVALNHISFEVHRGEIRGLIGENGSGKSTVSSIIAGMQSASSGEMFFEGKSWKPSSTLQAQQAGIAMIVQEAGTIPNITAAENIFLGHEELFSKGPFINRGQMNAAAQEFLDKLGISINASSVSGSLDMANRKLLEVAKALYWKPKLFIVDETTTALSHTGRILLYEFMKKLAQDGSSVLFISHELDELMEQCDTLTILRDGVIVGNLSKDEFESGRIKQMMVGREIKGNYYRVDMDGYSNEVALKAECITTMKDLLCFSMELHRGEILGIGGLSHCGMHTLGKALFGAEPTVDGRVIIPESNTVIRNPKIAVNNRIGYVSKDRDTESLSLAASIRDNIASTGYRLNRLFGPFLSFKKEKKYVDEQIQSLSLKCASQYHSVDTLSGGNKQKVAFGKWLACDANILILDCPTRGIDIGVKAAMYKLIYEMKKAGKSIVLISEELPELIGMSDRILIMRNGEISCEMRRPEQPTESRLVEYML
ncbi:MAG: sugar ABC transporter ATP-binding protein [Treponema sp.]|jgi:ribose transport system ATP-binding protein|nr:sugar ABC transporter ATP-binding protein [Treponema sp.]